MQRGTSQEASSSSVQVEAWRRRSCQRHLHRRHQRLFSPSQAAKWRTSCRRPRQVTALGQRARSSSLPERPSAAHPSLKMWRKHSMVSCSSMNRQASVCSTAAKFSASSCMHRRCRRGASHCCASTSTSTTPSAVSRDDSTRSHACFSHPTPYACDSTSRCIPCSPTISSSASVTHLP
ncbi:hypothetical protein C4D60_Mb06t13020 [Musa balbisiana]|uniref:Uncharacterized protein n=1 Tax=Musa balbisiana TaxID=52838 RepID=A0A4S8INE2_MUSBA|nr:hypothetical protein C4D60_Mb06t13020 [Musa balbisiana]